MRDEKLEIINNRGLRPHLKLMSETLYELQEATLLDDGGEEALDLITLKLAQLLNLCEELEIYCNVDFDELVEYKVKDLED